jgi:hypothetical protein
LAATAQAAAAGGADAYIAALSPAQASSFTAAAQAFAKEHGDTGSAAKILQIYGTALSGDLGLTHSSADVSNKWIELSRPGDVKFTAFFSVARQIYADKYGTAAALKLDQPHYVDANVVDGYGNVIKIQKLDEGWAYQQLETTFNQAVADYTPTYDANGNLKVADPVTRVAQFAQSWKFTYGGGGPPELTRPVTDLTNIQARAALGKLGDTASRYDRYMDLGSANPAAINILLGITTLGIGNLTQDLISKSHSKAVNNWIVSALQSRGRDPYYANLDKSKATAKVVFDGALTAVSIIDPLIRLGGPLAELTGTAARAGGGLIESESLAATAAESALGRTPPLDVAQIDAGGATSLSAGNSINFTARSVASPGTAPAYYAEVANITGATPDLVHIIPINAASTEWAAVDEAGNMLGRVNVNVQGRLDLSAGAHAMLGRLAGRVVLPRQVGSAAAGLPGYQGAIAGDVVSGNALETSESAILGPRLPASSSANPWQAPALTRGFAAEAVTGAGTAARQQVVSTLDAIGTGQPTMAQLSTLKSALADYTEQEFGSDLNLATTQVTGDFSQAARSKMLNILAKADPFFATGMTEEEAKFFGVLRPGESAVSPGFEAIQANSVKHITSGLKNEGLAMSQADFAKLSPASKNAWIEKAYSSIAKSLGLTDPPQLVISELDPGTAGHSLPVKGADGFIDPGLSKIILNKDGQFRNTALFDNEGGLINVMTHELTHAKQYTLINALQKGGAGLTDAMADQAALLDASDTYTKLSSLGSADPNYRLEAIEAQAFDMGDRVEQALNL